jgi:hypothetical protein
MDTFLRRGRPVPYETLAQLSGAQTVQKTRFLFNTGKRMFHRAVRTVLAELVSDPTRQEQELQDLAAILFRT